MIHKTNLSAVVIAKNEEKKLPDCLKSLEWVDELIVVDNGSTDKTVEIAKRHKALVYELKEGNYSDLRNYGLVKATNEFILYVDADERVTEELKKEILKISQDNPKNISMYAIPRKNIILGKELKHGWYPDYVKRLYKKEYLKKWEGNLHEEPVFEGGTSHLKNPLIHIKHDNLEEMVEKTNIWSDVEAKLMYQAGHPKMNILRFGSAMFREFFLRMIKQKAFLDGGEGVIYAMYQVWSRFISYAKLWELQLNNTSVKNP